MSEEGARPRRAHYVAFDVVFDVFPAVTDVPADAASVGGHVLRLAFHPVAQAPGLGEQQADEFVLHFRDDLFDDGPRAPHAIPRHRRGDLIRSVLDAAEGPGMSAHTLSKASASSRASTRQPRRSSTASRFNSASNQVFFRSASL